MDQYVAVLKKYTVFTGRSRRKEFWMFALINFGISFVVGLIGGLIHLSFIGNLYSLAVLVPSIAVGIRRMHDTGRSGWWILLPLGNLFFWAQDSQPGNNEYGANPKAA